MPAGKALANGTWLRYDSYNTVAATFGDTGAFRTNLYFFSAMRGPGERELLKYGQAVWHVDWAEPAAFGWLL